MKLYRRLLAYVRPYWPVFALAIAGMILVASTDVLMLRVVEPLLRGLQTRHIEPDSHLPLLIVAVFVLRGLGSYVSEFGLGWIGSRVGFELRRAAVGQLFRLQRRISQTR